MSDPNVIPVGAQNINWDFIHPFENAVFQAVGNKVLNGPFMGMEITSEPSWHDGALTTKLFGTYEHELWDTVYAAVARKPKVVVNVGCAEGYYTIGLARLLPEAFIYAIDIDKDALRLVEEYAAKNGVKDRVFTRYNGDDPVFLDLNIRDGHRLYVLDCEGAEFKLLDPDKCPALKVADFIVEYHDNLGFGSSTDLITRFMPTHNVVSISPMEDPPLVCELTVKFQLVTHILKISDKRFDGNGWLALWSHERTRQMLNENKSETS